MIKRSARRRPFSLAARELIVDLVCLLIPPDPIKSDPIGSGRIENEPGAEITLAT